VEGVLPTGCKAFDDLIGGGIHYGLLTDIYGESGTGKSQFCFTICARSVEFNENPERKTVVFVDTAGTFRPERIVEILGVDQGRNDLLERILVVRALSTHDQVDAVERLPRYNPRLVIIDDVASLFSSEYIGAARHLALMKHLHDLSLAAINLSCAVVITNMVRNVPSLDQKTRNPKIDGISLGQNETMPNLESREFMGTSVSIYAHMKLMLKVANPNGPIFKGLLFQPLRKKEAYYRISTNGITDI
jgi:RecA/RadA recombinase